MLAPTAAGEVNDYGQSADAEKAVSDHRVVREGEEAYQDQYQATVHQAALDQVLPCRRSSLVGHVVSVNEPGVGVALQWIVRASEGLGLVWTAGMEQLFTDIGNAYQHGIVLIRAVMARRGYAAA